MRYIASFTLLSLVAPAAAAQDDFGLEILEGEVQDEDAAAYDDAKVLLREERYPEALAALEEIRANPKFQDFHEQAHYDIAKALYRMGLFHSAVARFTEILEMGPKHAFFENSREWLFFIARRIDDKQRVVALIARFAKGKDLPAEYSSEFNYQLARFHFMNALDDTAFLGAEAEPADEGGGGDGGAFDFGDTDLGGGGGDKKGDDGKKKDDDDGGGFDFGADDLGGADDDGFEFDLGEVKTEVKEVPVAPPKGKGFSLEMPKNSAEALEQALKNLALVDESFPQYHKALYLKGLVYYAQEKFEPAVKAFREVVRVTHPTKGTVTDPQLREMAFFSLARVHYQFEQFRYAIFYYDRISRDSEAWLDALFESSWAHFRLGQYEKALGNLVTIQSPFFEDEYYPESQILKAITFYENCRYPEARSFLDDFKRQYQGVIDELGRLAGKDRDPTELYNELSALEAQLAAGEGGASEQLTRRILRLSFADKRFLSYRRSIKEVEAEVERLGAMEPPFVGTEAHAGLVKAANDRRDQLVKSAGRLLADKLTQERRFLRDLSSKLVRIQFEITKSEKLALEDTLRDVNQIKEALESYSKSTATDDERAYWPFTGEYWRDELGTYEYTLTRGCRPPQEDEVASN